jgi:hypothetical protein
MKKKNSGTFQAFPHKEATLDQDKEAKAHVNKKIEDTPRRRCVSQKRTQPTARDTTSLFNPTTVRLASVPGVYRVLQEPSPSCTLIGNEFHYRQSTHKSPGQ